MLHATKAAGFFRRTGTIARPDEVQGILHRTGPVTASRDAQ
jgi:hypothetical protein